MGRYDIHRRSLLTQTTMYSPSTSSPFGRTGGAAGAYRQVGMSTSVEDASPHRLIELLFDGYVEAISQARGALRNGQIEAKGKAIARAARIVDEGLKAALDLRAGGALAQDLHALYDYLGKRLTLANVRNDDSMLEECVRLIEPLRQAWRDIAGKVD
jgi:flagellar secretion chaperone FliS